MPTHNSSANATVHTVTTTPMCTHCTHIQAHNCDNDLYLHYHAHSLTYLSPPGLSGFWPSIDRSLAANDSKALLHTHTR